MSYEVFARKYRPRTFRELLGQDHVVQTLENAISQNRLAHAYLFVGPRGTGKTSIARIFAKALNCENGPSIDFDPDAIVCQEIAKGTSLDVLEIDGATNNGVEQIRDLKETVQYAPMSSRFKIYYIDEVHMLSTSAFNALLKTLEEPPAHVKFIFATTEPSKILPTILSRCQRFDLRPIPTPLIAEHLLHIAKSEGLTLDSITAHAIARGADGGMRDAQSMLDQLVAFCGNTVTESDVFEIFGFTAQESIASLCQSILDRDTPAALRGIALHADEGKDIKRFLTDLLGWLRSLLVFTADPESALAEIADELKATLKAQADKAGQQAILSVIEVLADAESKMRDAPNQRLHLEIGAIKAINTLGATSISDVLLALRGDTSSLPLAPPEIQAAPIASPSPAPAPALSVDPLDSAPEATAPPSTDQVLGIADLPALWAATLHALESRLPVKNVWLEGTQLKEIAHGRAQIALPAGSEDALSELSDPHTTKAVGETLSKLAGAALRSEFVIDPNLAPTSRATPESEPEPERPPEPAPSAPADPIPAPEPAESEQPSQSGEPEKDPLIQQALEVFQAKLEK